MRILLTSDMHYTTPENAKELKSIHPESIGSAANGKLFGMTSGERMEHWLAAIQAEHEKAPLDAIVILGDLSIDDPPYRNLPHNYCEKFRDEFLPRLPAPVYLIPGNHDSYTDEAWQGIFGTGRQFSALLGGCLWIFADTYQKPAGNATGSHYTPLDLDFVKGEMAAYPDVPVILAAHYFDIAKEPPEFAAFLQHNPRIVMSFMGHTHRYERKSLPGNIPLVDIGAYSYYTHPTNGVWNFNIFQPEWRWGYQMLELTAKGAETYHVFTAARYPADNGDFRFETERVGYEKTEFNPRMG